MIAMNTTKDTMTLKTMNRLKDIPTKPTQERDTPSVSKDIYVLCDGAIKKPNTTESSVLSLSSTLATADKKRVTNSSKKLSKKAKSRHTSHQLSRVDHTPLSQITSKKAVIWLQKLDDNKLAVQWNVPNNIQRNCQDLLLAGDKSSFVLRLYQNVSVGNSEWKTSQRTLEYPINILKRKCYINLENKGGGKFTAEIGVRSSNGRYIFIARSLKRSTALYNPEPQENRVEYKKSTRNLGKQVVRTPKLFKSTGKISQLPPSKADLANRDIIAESQVSGLYTDFLREGPKVLRRINENIAPSSVRAREEFLLALKAVESRQAQEKSTRRTELKSKRLDVKKLLEERYQKSPITSPIEKSGSYIPEHLGKPEINATGVMVASMLNTAGTVAIDVFKKGENKNLRGVGREIVKVQSKKALAKALKKSGIREKSELILSGKLEPGRRVRVGGLLINTEADGSFYVSCSIKNGKLHVPVEEIDAIIVE